MFEHFNYGVEKLHVWVCIIEKDGHFLKMSKKSKYLSKKSGIYFLNNLILKNVSATKINLSALLDFCVLIWLHRQTSSSSSGLIKKFFL